MRFTCKTHTKTKEFRMWCVLVFACEPMKFACKMWCFVCESHINFIKFTCDMSDSVTCNLHATRMKHTCKYCVFRMRKPLLLGSDYNVFNVVHMWIASKSHENRMWKFTFIHMRKNGFHMWRSIFRIRSSHFVCDSYGFTCEKGAFACDACWCEPHAKMSPLLM